MCMASSKRVHGSIGGSLRDWCFALDLILLDLERVPSFRLYVWLRRGAVDQTCPLPAGVATGPNQAGHRHFAVIRSTARATSVAREVIEAAWGRVAFDCGCPEVYCRPRSSEVECPRHSGFSVCCDRSAGHVSVPQVCAPPRERPAVSRHAWEAQHRRQRERQHTRKDTGRPGRQRHARNRNGHAQHGGNSQACWHQERRSCTGYSWEVCQSGKGPPDVWMPGPASEFMLAGHLVGGWLAGP